MTEKSLVAPVRSSRKAWTGSSLADSIEGLVDAIKSEGWVDDALAGVAVAGGSDVDEARARAVAAAEAVRISA